MNKKEKEYKKLRKDVMSFLKSENRTLYVGANKKIYKFLSTLMVFLFFRALASIVLSKDQSLEFYILEGSQCLGTFLYFIAFHLTGKEPPTENKEEWLWRNGKRVILLLPLAGIILAIPMISNLNLKPVNNIAVILSMICISVISLTILIIAKNPKYFLRSFPTGFGTALVIIAPLVLPFIFFPSDNSMPKFLFWPVTFSIGFTFSYITFKNNILDRNFNLIQNSTLRFLRPRAIINALPTTVRTALKQEKKALRIEEKLEKKEEYEVELFLLERLKNKYPEEKNYWFGIVVGIFSFITVAIISALIEFIAQDVIYAPYLKEIICKYLNCK